MASARDRLSSDWRRSALCGVGPRISSELSDCELKPAEAIAYCSYGVRLQHGWMAKNGNGPRCTPTKLIDLPKIRSATTCASSCATNPLAAPSANQAQSL